MKFIEILIENSGAKEAKLYLASKKASTKPDTGITILKQAAYHVIKDCAKIAHLYIPLYVFGYYSDPFQTLKNKFQKKDIEEFVRSAESDFVHNQLLTLILNKIKSTQEIIGKKSLLKPESIYYNPNDIEPFDPYGDYGSSAYEEPAITVKDPTNESDLDLLCRAFGVE